MYPLQSEHIGTNIFDLILSEDHKDVKDAMKNSEIDSMSGLKGMHVCCGNTIWSAYRICGSFRSVKFLCCYFIIFEGLNFVSHDDRVH